MIDQGFAVLQILDPDITIDSISAEWIGRFVWLMQEARAKAQQETTDIFLAVKKRAAHGKTVIGEAIDSGSLKSV